MVVSMEYEEHFQKFHANDLIIAIKPITVEYLIRRIKQGTIITPPSQRNTGLWDDAQKSRLIESILLSIPLPMFYVATDSNNNWKIIDGLQRITTIDEFVNKNIFKLSNLQYLDTFNNNNFTDLPIAYQNKILETTLQFAIIDHNTPDDIQCNIFERLNTGGLPLSSQEIRHAMHYGVASSNLLKDLAINFNEMFKCTIDDKYTIDDTRMELQEIILRSLAFQIQGYKEYPKSDNMSIFLDKAIGLINTMSVDDINFLKKNFIIALSRAFTLFGRHVFCKSMFSLKKTNKTPFNKSLFEIWICILSCINNKSFDILSKKIKNIFMINLIISCP